jgi:hypothetical protein
LTIVSPLRIPAAMLFVSTRAMAGSSIPNSS